MWKDPYSVQIILKRSTFCRDKVDKIDLIRFISNQDSLIEEIYVLISSILRNLQPWENYYPVPSVKTQISHPHRYIGVGRWYKYKGKSSGRKGGTHQSSQKRSQKSMFKENWINLFFLVPVGTYFYLEPPHTVHTRLRKDLN